MHGKCMQKLNPVSGFNGGSRQSPQAIGLKFGLNHAHSRGIPLAKAQQQIHKWRGGADRRGNSAEFVTTVIAVLILQSICLRFSDSQVNQTLPMNRKSDAVLQNANPRKQVVVTVKPVMSLDSQPVSISSKV